MKSHPLSLHRYILIYAITLIGIFLASCSPNLPGQDLADQAQGEMESGNLDQDIQEYSQAVAQSPENAAFYQRRGYAYLSKNLLDLALDDFNRVIALDPKYAMAYNNRSYVYKLQNDPSKALADFQKILQLGEHAELLTNAQTELEELRVK
jgi:tetratricopeptide (TPR) repeat protein